MKVSEKELIIGRRNALKMIGLGSAVMLSSGFSDIMAAEPADMKAPVKSFNSDGGKSPVAFTTGTDRQQMIFEVMNPFRSELAAAIKNKKVVLKVNMVVTNVPLCATHKDALRAVMEYLKPIYNGQFIVAESCSNPDTAIGFSNYGYTDLANEYNIRFVDINEEEKIGRPCYILDRNMHLETIYLSDILTDPEYYVISISRLKTHNAVVMTGGTKNLAMGAPLYPDPGSASYKRNMHSGGSRFLHYNIFVVNQQSRPDFTVIDGVEGMEGDGPISGTPVDHKIAMAGFDTVAVDSMCARLMDVPLENVGYLNYCAAAGMGVVDRDKIEIIGSQVPENHIIKYSMNRNIESQLQWKEVPFIYDSTPQAPRQPAPPPAPSS